MNFWDILILAAVAVLVWRAALRVKKRGGKCGQACCSGSCGGCSCACGRDGKQRATERPEEARKDVHDKRSS